MKKQIIGVLVFLLAISLCACGKGESAVQPPSKNMEQNAVNKANEANEVNEGEIDVQIETEAQKYLLEDGKTLGLDYSAQKPVVTITGNEGASKAINDDIEMIYQSFKEGGDKAAGIMGIDETLEEAQKYWTIMKEDGSENEFAGYVLYREVWPAAQNDKVLSLVYEEYTYLGGAHGGSFRFATNYDSQTGNRILLEDLMVDPASFTQFCTNKMIEMSTGPRYENGEIWFEDYKENIPALVSDGSWYFSDEGLVFIANEYALAPYAAGIIEFTIPYSELQGVVKDQYLF